MTDTSQYTPPEVWVWEKSDSPDWRYGHTNRPVAGATHEKELPRGTHPLQLYSLGTPNGVKVTIMLEELLAAGHSVRVLVRNAAGLADKPWAADVDVAVGDILDRDAVRRALVGVDLAYYLIHSMMSEGFEELDRRAASIFATSAPTTLQRIIYLGGLLPNGERRSAHLRSRAEVGKILRRTARVLEFRAGPIVGAGSASFEMLRYLTERLPAMVAPRWINNLVQPVAVDDVVRYLVLGAARDVTGVVEIGGDRLTFGDMMRTFAKIRGLLTDQP